MKCRVNICDREIYLKGLCLRHYLRKKRHGHVRRLNRDLSKLTQEEKKKLYKERYSKKYKCKKRVRGFSTSFMHKKRFGGKRDIVLKRDNFRCVMCNMNNFEHKHLFMGRSLTVNHIDGHGRYSSSPNNKLDNLQTLCLPCHGRKDSNKYWQTQKEGEITK